MFVAGGSPQEFHFACEANYTPSFYIRDRRYFTVGQRAALVSSSSQPCELLCNVTFARALRLARKNSRAPLSIAGKLRNNRRGQLREGARLRNSCVRRAAGKLPGRNLRSDKLDRERVRNRYMQAARSFSRRNARTGSEEIRNKRRGNFPLYLDRSHNNAILSPPRGTDAREKERDCIRMLARITTRRKMYAQVYVTVEIVREVSFSRREMPALYRRILPRPNVCFRARIVQLSYPSRGRLSPGSGVGEIPAKTR